MKKIKSLFVILAGLSFMLAGCGGKSEDPGKQDDPIQVIQVTGVSLNKKTLTLEVDATEQLSCTVLPENAANKSVSWNSSDNTIATVNNGLVTAKKAGTATITVTTEDGSYTDTCSVTVNAKVVNVTSVSLNKKTLTLDVDGSEQLVATVLPNNATNNSVTWSSSDSSVAVVSNGLVTAKSAGSATITVATQDGSFTDTCAVTVNPKIIHVNSVTLDKTSITLLERETQQLSCIVLPDNATNKSIVWESTNNEVATVENGLVSAKKAGTAIISASSVDGSIKATCNVGVTKKEPQQEDGCIKLDNNIIPVCGDEAYSLTYGDYDFELAYTSESVDGYIAISKGGYFLNTTAFGDILSFKVDYDVVAPSNGQVQSDLGFGSLYYTTDTHKITSPRSYVRNEVVDNGEITLSGIQNYIAFYTFNEIDIKSITINYDKTKTYTETFENFDLKLFATNDIHGQVNPDSSHAGLDSASGYIESKKSQYNLLFDQGDIYQGSLACYLTGGHIMDDYLLVNGYESTILGNHEWDWTETNVISHREYLQAVKCLACNVRYKDGTTPDWVQNYYITERGGIKIGVIGALGDIIGDISADMVENIQFVVDKPKNSDYSLTNLISQYSNELKQQGCDYIVLQVHAGSTYGQIYEETMDAEYTEITYSKLKGKVDFVLESHSHRSYYNVDQYGISHLQCGGYLNGLGNVTLGVTFNQNKPTIAVKNVTIANVSTLKACNSSFFAAINEWYSTNVYKEESERIVTTVPTSLGSDEINQLAADAYYYLTTKYSQDLSGYDVSVAGGHIVCRSPKKISAGEVTMSDITNLFPFDNEMYLVKMGGRDLKYNFLNSSGNVFGGGKMDSSTRTDFDAYYYVLLDSYNYFFLTKQRTPNKPITIEVNLTEKYGIYPRDVVASYLQYKYPTSKDELILNYINFDYSNSPFTKKVGDAAVTITHSNIVKNASYEEFTVKKNNGILKIQVSSGYKIINADIHQYGNYSNLVAYKDANCTVSMSYNVSNGHFSLTPETDVIVIKNPSNYDVNLYSITLKLVTN